MHARVAKFEGVEAEKLRETVSEMKQRAESGPPEGVPATGFLLLANPDEGHTLAISLFETEADLQKGHETLSAMDPPVDGGMGKRTSIELYEVAVKLEA